MQKFFYFGLALSLSFFISISACGTPEPNGEKNNSGEQSGDASTPTDKAAIKAPFGSKEDVDKAKAIWQEMSSYKTWKKFPGQEGDSKGFVSSSAPHGKFVKFFANKGDKLNDEGSIIIKENYPEKDDSKLSAITVMKKIGGFNSDNGDWFWIKFSKSGEVLKNPKGISLAGKIGKGGSAGCIPCHSSAGDYILTKH